MLSNYWNPPFSYLIIIKKDVCRNLSKLISFLFSNHPNTYTDRGEKLRWQKHNLNLINYNFSNYISASILHSKIHSTFEKKFYDAFLKITRHHPTFPHQGHTGVKLTLSVRRPRLFLQNEDTSVQPSYSSLGCDGAKTSKLKC